MPIIFKNNPSKIWRVVLFSYLCPIKFKPKAMKKVQLNYWDCLRKTKQYPSGGYYQDQTSEIVSQKTIEAETDIQLFEQFYKLNNSLRYCNGSYYKWVDLEMETKYSEWLKSDDYKKKSFTLFYGGGIVD